MNKAVLSTLLLCSCAAPGYHYETGDFFTQTPNQQGPAWVNGPATSVAPSAPATPEQIRAAQQDALQRQQDAERQSACSEYQILAAQIADMKASGTPFEVTTKWASDQAYGPSGQVFRWSQNTETLALHLVGAAYFGNGLYGKTPQEFDLYAYKICMQGKTF